MGIYRCSVLIFKLVAKRKQIVNSLGLLGFLFVCLLVYLFCFFVFRKSYIDMQDIPNSVAQWNCSESSPFRECNANKCLRIKHGEINNVLCCPYHTCPYSQNYINWINFRLSICETQKNIWYLLIIGLHLHFQRFPGQP